MQANGGCDHPGIDTRRDLAQLDEAARREFATASSSGGKLPWSLSLFYSHTVMQSHRGVGREGALDHGLDRKRQVASVFGAVVAQKKTALPDDIHSDENLITAIVEA